MNYTNDDHDVLLFVTINIVLFIVTLKQQKRRTMSGTNMDGNRSACLYEEGRDTEGQVRQAGHKQGCSRGSGRDEGRRCQTGRQETKTGGKI